MGMINLKRILSTKKYFILGLLICVVALSGCLEQPDLRVQKKVDPSFASLGTKVVYKYNITNYNNTFPAQDITLVDDHLGSIILTDTDLGPGESMIVTQEHEVNETDLKTLYEGVFIANNVTVNGTINGEKIPYSPNTASALVATPVRIIQKTASTKEVKLGDEINYEITIYNPTDTVDMINVTVKDTFDQSVDFVSANPMPSEGNDIWIFDSIGPKESETIALVIKPQEQETPYQLKNCATITDIDDQTIEEYLDGINAFCPDIAELLPYFHDCESITVVSREYSTMDSFEELLRDQHRLLVSFSDLMGQTPVTRDQKIEFLYSIEDLYRRQAIGMDRFSSWIDENWGTLTQVEKAQITDSLEDLLRRQAKNLEAFNGNLLAWVKTFEQPYRQKFSDSFEDLLHRQAALLKKFVFVLHQDGMQTPTFLSSLEDLLRRQAQSLEGFGDLGEFTFDPAPPLKGPGIAIYKTADKTSLSCSEEVTYNYTVYNNGDQEVTGIEVTDPNLPGGPVVGTIPSLGVYQSETIEKTVTYGCLPDVVYPTQVCNNATAKGTTSSGATVEAKSNEVCIILNGPRQPTPPEKCPDRSNYPGQGVTVRGGIVKGAENCIILTADDGSVYELGEDDAKSWVKVQDILAKGGCAEISGCAYVGLPTTYQQGTPLYVTSCQEIDCLESYCPSRSGNLGQDVTLTGTIMELFVGGCFVLTDKEGVKYELEKDELYPDAWTEVRAIQQKGGCAEIRGCVYKEMNPVCPTGSGMPVYVKSCKEVACPEPSEPSCTPMTNAEGKPVSGVLATKVGPLGDPANSCPYILYYSYQVSPDGPTETKKYWLTVDEANNQYKAEYDKLLNHGKGDYVKVYGCIYEGLESPCEGVPDAIPMYVRSVEVYPICEGASQVPFIDRGTIIQDTSCVVFSSTTGHGKLELLQDPNYLDAWKIIEDFKDTSKMVEIYGCLDPSDVIGNCKLQILHVRAAVPLVGAMAIEPIEKVPNEVVPSSEGCKTCKGSVPDASAKPIVAIPEGNQTQVAVEVTDKSAKPMSKIPEGSQSGLEGNI
jgi:uncharacterized repeat protein (TIGR01451 family)